jgi:hypothetical protein
MSYKVKVTQNAEEAHYQAMAAVRRAIRAGDLAKTERWLKLADRYWKLDAHVDAAQRARAEQRLQHLRSARWAKGPG